MYIATIGVAIAIPVFLLMVVMIIVIAIMIVYWTKSEWNIIIRQENLS